MVAALIPGLRPTRPTRPAPDPADHAIVCDRVAKRYRVFAESDAWRVLFYPGRGGQAIDAVRGVSLAVPKGEILGVLGRNGSGKSTLLRVAGGVYDPTEGSVRLAGTVGSLFELGGLGNQFITGREYAERVLRFQGVPRRSLRLLLSEIREFSELGEYFDRRVHTYSSGMGARLYFATAMALPREVFLIDEILSVGDAHFQAKSWRRVRERLAEGASGILVTHDWSAVVKLCRRAIILDKGKVAAEGPADQIVAQYLDLPRPDCSIVRFGEMPSSFRGVSGEDLTLSFPIESHQDVAIEFACSIELLRLGIGWEIVILSEFLTAGRGRGNRNITLTIPHAPLAPGEYSLNVFLRAAASNGGAPADARTWTMGTGLKLIISGSETAAITRLPVSWRVKELVTAPHA